VIGMKLRRIVEQIRGAKGSRVHLTIIPHDGGDSSLRRQVTLVRDVIKLNSARAAASLVGVPADAQGSVPVGVITLNLFYGPADDSTDGSAKSSATRDVAELVGKLKTQGAKALVIDLRRNGGGLLNEAISLAGLFIGQRPVVQVRSSNDKNDVFADENNVVVWDGPLAVLTSRFSASSSEIFAGALQNYGRAIIVGDSSTHGKGTVQAVLDMKNYLPNRRREPPPRTGAAKLTVQKFYLPNGASTQKKGITPDLTLPSIDDFMPVGEASLPRAMMWDEIKSTHDFVGKPLTKSFLEPLRQASVDRQTHLEEFSFLKKNIDWFKMKQDQKNISLNLETRRQQKEADDQFKKEMDAERERLAVSNFVNQDVKLAAVEQQQAAAKKTPPVKDEETDADAPEKKEAAKFDIHLRETLRVVVDALSLGKDSKYWADGRPPITWTPSGKS
jgi:carboxyl-terminal processing protease